MESGVFGLVNDRQAAGQYQVAPVVGLPLGVSEKLYNCAALITSG